MFRLMLVTDRHDTAGRDLVEVVRLAVEGGVDCVQVREKDLDDDALLRLTERIVEAAAGRAAVVVNGRRAVAEALGVGLHLPEEDALPSQRSSPYGRSVHSVDGALKAKTEEVDYLLLGTIYETSSKPGLEGSGVALVRRVVEAAGDVPVLAIGGIDDSNAGELRRAGAFGVAVRSAILRAPDPAKAAGTIRAALG